MTDNLSTIDEIKDLHRFLTIIQNINVGIIVLDKQFRVHVWNSFMEVNSGIMGGKLNGKCILDFFPELSNSWFKDKVLGTFALEATIFSPWEQHTEIFHFANNRPFTGTSKEMYQNYTFIPINTLNGTCEEICVIIYDVTDAACSKINLQAANERLHQMSITDGLTSLYNRKHWQECLNQQFKLHMRNHADVSLMMFDIDHFKNVNDTYGHPAGDAVLKAVSATLKKQIRSTDIAGRYGGEEFAIILIDANKEAAYMVAERLRNAVAALVVDYEDLQIKFNISIGICTLNQDIESADKWLQNTDNSLYFSKEHGRNRSTLFSVNDTEETMNVNIPKPASSKR